MPKHIPDEYDRIARENRRATLHVLDRMNAAAEEKLYGERNKAGSLLANGLFMHSITPTLVWDGLSSSHIARGHGANTQVPAPPIRTEQRPNQHESAAPTTVSSAWRDSSEPLRPLHMAASG